MIRPSEVRVDCRHFRGDVPCQPNKVRNKICPSCDEYDPVQTRILIIKLGAAGDVIRTTPLVLKFREIFPHAQVSWITHTPEVVPRSCVNTVYRFGFEAVYAITHQHFDVALNLDKDVEACALLQDVQAGMKFGFTLKDGIVGPVNQLAEHKFLTGLFDQASKENKKSYLEEIFEMCGYRFNHEPYVLDVDPKWESMWETVHRNAGSRRIIGLNTGCGERWLTRLWPESHWITLVDRLHEGGYYPLLLGGPYEDELNRRYEEQTGAYYPGTFTLSQFISLVSQCHAVATAVTMTMHIAIGTRVPLVLFNNIFNPNEFELYGRGIMLQPPSGCDCYFGQTCSRERPCMNDIAVDTVYDAIVSMAGKPL